MSIEWGELGASAALTVAGKEPFKGVLLYTTHGHFEEPLPPTLRFKADCDSGRGTHRTVTHVNPKVRVNIGWAVHPNARGPALLTELIFTSIQPKDSVDLSLHLPEDLDAAEHFVLNAVVLKSFQEWYWINSTLADHPHPYL